MAVPSNRVPVRVARGLKSALTANLADLLEGELLYAKDEDKLYMVEGGVLVAMGADLAASSIGDLNDVTLTSAAGGEVLRYNGSAWVDAQLAYSDLSGTPTLGTAAAADTTDFATAAQGTTADSAVQPTDSINALADVDTITSAPTTGQVLEWDGSNWVPATPAAGGVTSIIAGTGISVDQATGDVTITATGGGGGGVGVATRTSDSGTASSGELTLTGLGSSGMLHTLSTDLDAWVVFYGSAADRTADAGRAYNTDPTAGSGVLAEAYVTTAGAILFTPGTGYMNNDVTETAALYLAVRDQAGAAVNATLTVTAYVQGSSNAAVTRTLLGIGEYVDDAAAGAGGVTSGAMYYNTTSSDYRLKT